MPLINRIEISNFMNSRREDPWRPDWAFQMFVLKGENSAINMPNGKGKSTISLAVLAMLTHDKSLNEVRRKHFAPQSTGHFSHIRMETHIWTDDDSPNDLIAQAGGDFGGYPMVFGIYGNAGETGSHRFYSYRGTLEECAIGRKEGNRVTLVGNNDFRDKLETMAGKFPASQRDDTRTNWRDHVSGVFDMPSIEQQLIYQKAKGAEGSHGYFGTKLLPGRTYAETVFYERLAPELLVDMMGNIEEYAGERGIEDTIHEKVQGIISAKSRTAKTAEELERTRHVLDELERIRVKAETVTSAKAEHDAKLAEFSVEYAALKELVIDNPIPGMPCQPGDDAPTLAKVMVMQEGLWFLPDRSFDIFTGEMAGHINERSNKNRIETTSASKSQLIDYYIDIKIRDDRGKANQLYDAKASIALLGVTTNFKNGYTLETATQTIEKAFAWVETNGDTNPARREKRELTQKFNDANTRRNELASQRDALQGEKGKLKEEQQQIDGQQAEFRRMAESGLFTEGELASPAETGRKVGNAVGEADGALAGHLGKVSENKEIFADWKHFVADHGEDADPSAIADLLESKRDAAEKDLQVNQDAIRDAKGKSPALKLGVESKNKHLATLTDKTGNLDALRPLLATFATRFDDAAPTGLEQVVKAELKKAETRSNAIGIDRAKMKDTLDAWDTFGRLHGTAITPKAWLDGRAEERTVLTGEIEGLKEEIRDARARRGDLDKAAVAPGKVAREVLDLAGEDSEPLHAAVEKMGLPTERKARILTLFSALLFSPVYASAERATEAAQKLAEHGWESPVFLADELATFCRSAEISYNGTVARTWLVGIRTRPVDCLLDPSLVAREKADLDGKIEHLGERLTTKETRFAVLDPEADEAIVARKAKEAADHDYPSKDAALKEELEAIGNDLPRQTDRASDDAVSSIRAVIEFRALLAGETEEALAIALAAAAEAARQATAALAENEELVSKLDEGREQLQKIFSDARVAATGAPKLRKIRDFADAGGPVFMTNAPTTQRSLEEEKRKAHARNRFRFDLAETFVRAGDQRPREIESRLQEIEPEMDNVVKTLLPAAEAESKRLGERLPALEPKIMGIDNLVMEFRKKYREMARSEGAPLPVSRERLAAHPLVEAAARLSFAYDADKLVDALIAMREPLADIEASNLKNAVEKADQICKSARGTLGQEIERVKNDRNVALNEQMRIGLENAKDDIQELVRMILVTKDNHDKSKAANETASRHLDEEWEGIGAWLENFTRRLPGNFDAMKSAFKPVKDSVSGEITSAGFEIEARLADMKDVRAVLTGIVETVEKRERSREGLGDDEDLRAINDKSMRKQIRDEFYRNVLAEPKIRVCIPSISRKPLMLDRDMVSSGQGIAMTLLWIVKMADYVTERESCRQNVSNAARRKARSNRTQFVIIDGAFSHLSNRSLIKDALDGVRRTRGKFQLIITGHDPNYKNDYEYFPTYVSAREIGGNMMYADSETRRLVSPEDVGSRNGTMELATWHKLPDGKAA
jgi:hypothetical protein